MSQCVPSWDLDDDSPAPPNKLSTLSSSNSISGAPDVPMLGYRAAELTWENGQLAMHGLVPPRVPAKPAAYTSPSKYTWDKALVNGTLESLVKQATCLPGSKPNFVRSQELVPWLDHHNHRHVLLPKSSSPTMTTDALVPCSNRTENLCTLTAADPMRAGVLGTCLLGCSTRVGCCSGHTATRDEDDGHLLAGKRAREARVAVVPSRDQSVSASANTFRRDSKHVTLDKRERDLGGAGFSSASFGSQENNSTGRPMTATADDENDSVCHSRPQREAGEDEDKKKRTGKSSVSTKRSRAAAIHNQSERKRRDKINERMKTLQEMVPNSSKTDKASMLDEVIDYLKQLQAQVQMMSRMNMQFMMLPMAMQQQLQMSMMAAMSFGMGMGMGVMDMTQIVRSNVAGIPPVQHPTAFMPMTSWDGSIGGDHRLHAASSIVMPDQLSAFLACQSQPMTMDAYSRMAASCQQLQQQQQQQQQLSPNFRS